MFYEPGKTNHGLPRDPFKSLIVPRPIAWITSVGSDGTVNLAPYSYFNICSSVHPAIMFAPSTRPGTATKKDTHQNVELLGEFVVNIVTDELREKVEITAGPHEHGVSEVALAGLTVTPSNVVAAPRLAESPINMECRHLMTVTLPNRHREPHDDFIVIGEVVGIHIRDDVLTNGFVDIAKLRPLTKLGYLDYSVITEAFSLKASENSHFIDR